MFGFCFFLFDLFVYVGMCFVVFISLLLCYFGLVLLCLLKWFCVLLLFCDFWFVLFCCFVCLCLFLSAFQNTSFPAILVFFGPIIFQFCFFDFCFWFLFLFLFCLSFVSFFIFCLESQGWMFLLFASCLFVVFWFVFLWNFIFLISGCLSKNISKNWKLRKPPKWNMLKKGTFWQEQLAQVCSQIVRCFLFKVCLKFAFWSKHHKGKGFN